MSELKLTPLHDTHVAAGATMVDFGGWEMPIQYPSGIVAEHLNTRRNCGIFDVSHMGRLIIEGPDRVAFLQKVLSSNVEALAVGRAQYCIIPAPDGSAVDDAYLYRFEEDRYLLVVNASNTDKDLAHFATIAPAYQCTVTDITGASASIALQGPDSEQLLQTLSGCSFITGPKRNDLNTLQVEGRTVQISRTGYTGEPIGYELFLSNENVVWLWNRLVELGAMPTGLGARDTLRLEASLPLYGHEMGLDPESKAIPVFAVSLAKFAVSFLPEKGDFVGRKALEEQFAAYQRIVAKDFCDIAVLPSASCPTPWWIEALCGPVCGSIATARMWAGSPAAPWFPIISSTATAPRPRLQTPPANAPSALPISPAPSPRTTRWKLTCAASGSRPSSPHAISVRICRPTSALFSNQMPASWQVSISHTF